MNNSVAWGINPTTNAHRVELTAPTTEGTLNKMVAYYNSDTNYKYEYYCEAVVWSSLVAPLWRIFRVRYTVSDWKFFDKTWAWTDFNNAATDLATVEWYTYS